MCANHDAPSTSPRLGLKRRDFLSGAAGLAASLALTTPAIASTVRSDFPYARFLWIENATTREVVNAPFTLDGRTLYLDGYFKLCRIMRDFHVDTQDGYVEIDVRLLEGMYEVQQILGGAGVREPIVVFSGYRTPQTNAEVGGVLHSYHQRAMAADFYVAGTPLKEIWDICNSRPVIGGLGYYPNDGHIHIDCGPRRQWEG